MQRRKSYYKAYKGRRSSRSKLLLCFAILAFLLALLALAYFILPEFIVFTADGFHFTFQPEPEQTAEESQPAGSGTEEDLPIVINGQPAGGDTPSTGADPAGETTQAPVFPALLGVSDNISNLLRSGYAAGLEKAALERGCNTLCFTVKGTDGIVQIPLVSAYSTQAAQRADAQDICEALDLLADSDIYLAARITALCDDAAAHAFPESALRTDSGATWLDRGNIRWIDPRSDMAAEYLCDLIHACKNAGFDAVIFDHLCFPYAGKTELIDYGGELQAEDRAAALESLFQQLRATADKEGISLSVVLEQDDAETALSGQSAELLARYFHTVFVEGTLSAQEEADLRAAVSDSGCRIGVIHKNAFRLPSGDDSVIAGYLE